MNILSFDSFFIGINKYFSYESRFNGVFSRDNLPKIKDGAMSLRKIDETKKKISEEIKQ